MSSCAIRKVDEVTQSPRELSQSLCRLWETTILMLYDTQWSVVDVGIVAFVAWKLTVYAYRLFFHPLASFPGPKLAAATWIYEFYYDVCRSGGGLYIWKIKELHDRYGPIVRINPCELHIADPDFYDTIYAGATSTRNKWRLHQKAAQAEGAIGHTEDHQQHRLRKDSLSGYFSKTKTREREPMIRAKVDQLCARIAEYADEKRVVNFTAAYLAFAMDIITEYAFGQSYDLLKADDFHEEWRDTILSVVSSVATIVHLPWLPGLMKVLPTSLANAITPDISVLLDYEKRVTSQVSAVLNYTGNYKKSNPASKATIFEELRDSSKLPSSEKTLKRLTDEGNVLLIAGSETSAKVMALITYHLIANPRDLDRVREEIASLQREASSLPSLSQLESLPFYSSVIREGLRLHNGIVQRSQRISPVAPLQYKDWVIPTGTPMSCTSIYLHYNSETFPEPLEFRPERWMVEGTRRKQLDKFYVPFGRGTRSCLGGNLGLAELYLGLAAVITRFDLVLYETGRWDVDLERDWFIPQPWIHTKGVRAIASKRAKKT